jgi:hypothetical protein
MTRYALAAMALGVWLTGAASAAALTYELGRPPTPADGTTDVLMSKAAAPEQARPEGTIAVSPPGHALRHPHVAPPLSAPSPFTTTPPAPRDIDEMNCAEWRELDMGSGHVRICE